MLGNVACEFGIEAMDALHEQDVAILELERVAQVLSFSLLEIVGGHSLEVLVELLQVKGIE